MREAFYMPGGGLLLFQMRGPFANCRRFFAGKSLGIYQCLASMHLPLSKSDLMEAPRANAHSPKTRTSYTAR
jgi:hypothetical protein